MRRQSGPRPRRSARRSPPAQSHPRILLGSLSRRRLALRAGIHYGYLSRILHGKRRPSMAVSKRVADALGLSLDDFYAKLLRVTKAAARVGEWPKM